MNIQELKESSFQNNKNNFIPQWEDPVTSLGNSDTWDKKIEELMFGQSFMYTGSNPFTTIKPFVSVRQGDVIYRIAPMFLSSNNLNFTSSYNLYLKTSQPAISGYTLSIEKDVSGTYICFNLSKNILLDGIKLNFNFNIGSYRWVFEKELLEKSCYHITLSDDCKAWKENSSYNYYKGASLIWLLYKESNSNNDNNLFREEIFCDATSKIISSKKSDRSSCIKMLLNYNEDESADLVLL